MWRKRMQQHWNSTKNFIHAGYSNLGKWAKEVDRGVNIFQKVFNLATPAISDLGGGEVIKQGVGVIDKYNQLKTRVNEIDTKARGYGRDFDNSNIFE